MKKIILKKNEERRLLSGHQWVFSNEIKSVEDSPLVGEIIDICRQDGKTIGIGFYNPHSLIAARFLSEEACEIDSQFFKQRIERALKLRKKIFPGSDVYRLVYGESDYLPGLIIDRYNQIFSVQTLSAGMDQRLPLICQALTKLFSPLSIIEKNESTLRSLEQLPTRKGFLLGNSSAVTIEEHGLKYSIDVLEGQKTGFYLDQRLNRVLFSRYCRDADVLDVFCNDGGFALNAANAGAKSVVAIDSSEPAIARVRSNIPLNGIPEGIISSEVSDALEYLQKAAADGKKFDAVNIDPPPYARNKKFIREALQGYFQINAAALALVKEGGIFASSSCSHHISEEDFLSTVHKAARSKGRNVRLLHFEGASPDHPVLIAMPETKYLKFAVFVVE
jgi:23S rRNA (cytosine1962-C5)-methyltransferase